MANYDQYGNPIREKSSKEQIDEAVALILAAPRKTAEELRVKNEIAARTALIEKVGVEDTYAVGTVIKFTRDFGGQTPYAYAALKVQVNDEGATTWHVTGSGRGDFSSYGTSWDELTAWFFTGNSVITSFEVSDGFTKLV